MIVTITTQALRDIERIGDHIAKRNPARALSFIREMRESCHALADKPLRFPLVPRYEHYGVRRRVHGNYLIFYRATDECVDIIHVLHGAMDYERILFPDLTDI